MTGLLLGIAMFVIAAAVTSRVARHLAVASPLRRVNYRGLSVATAVGISIVLGVLAASAAAAFLHALFDESDPVWIGYTETFFFAIAAAGFALLGLWDDLTGSAAERGWRAHITALRHGKATSGAVKILGGAALATGIATALTSSFGWAIVGALVIALSANGHNLLDVRPGRAIKWFLVAMVALLFIIEPSPVAAAAGASVAFLPYDLRERAMLGNTGAMALGAMTGVGFVYAGPTVELVALFILVVMHLVADKPGLSGVIDAVPPLRVFDRAGRVPE